jgi:hypothetical protein
MFPDSVDFSFLSVTAELSLALTIFAGSQIAVKQF